MSKFDSHLSALKALYNDATSAAEAAGGIALAPADEFTEFKKIPRLNRDIVITEKIDGTNAQILIEEWPSNGLTAPGAGERDGDALCVYVNGEFPAFRFRAGQRTRWATPERDNFGFARWAFANAEDLVNLLGVGRHFGEWWGAGVQRTYGLKEKRFSLFNVHRYGAKDFYLDPRCVKQGEATAEVQHKFHKGEKKCACTEGQEPLLALIGGVVIAPVPTLYRGPWFIAPPNWLPMGSQGELKWAPQEAINWLTHDGSRAVPGFMDPEGIVVFHEASGNLFKVTCKNDEKPKGSTE